MSMTTYKGYRVLVRPYLLHESERWTADLEIRRHGRTQPVAHQELYVSQAEAERECLVRGQRIIDGDVPGVSVDRLRNEHERRARSLNIAEGPTQRRDRFGWMVMVGLGVFVLMLGAGFATRGEASPAGGFGVAVENFHAVPPWVGGGAMALGVLLIVAGARQHPASGRLRGLVVRPRSGGN